MTLRTIKNIFVFVVFATVYVVIAAFHRLTVRDLNRRRLKYMENVSLVSSIACRFWGFKVKVINPPAQNQPYLFVSNHLGFLDILMMSCFRPCCYITSMEMRKTPLLGFFTEIGGCLYVERRTRTNINQEINEIRKALRNGLSVMLYPEGTSTDGEMVYPFKKSLMTAAAGTEIGIMPMVLNYRKVNGEPMSHKWRDHVFWYGDQYFFPSFLKMMSLKSIEAELRFFDPILGFSEEQRSEVAQKAYEILSAHYSPVLYPPGVAKTYVFRPPKPMDSNSTNSAS